MKLIIDNIDVKLSQCLVKHYTMNINGHPVAQSVEALRYKP